MKKRDIFTGLFGTILGVVVLYLITMFTQWEINVSFSEWEDLGRFFWLACAFVFGLMGTFISMFIFDEIIFKEGRD